jgi:hypothetical protein
MDMREFLKNRSTVSPADLEKYGGKYVGWSPDGSRIIAADDNPMNVVASLKAAGFDPAECVLSSIPAAEEFILGGGLDEFLILGRALRFQFLRWVVASRGPGPLLPFASLARRHPNLLTACSTQVPTTRFWRNGSLVWWALI